MAGGRLEVGRVARAHGLRGQVVVELVSNRDERVAVGSILYTAEDRRLDVVASTSAPGAGRRWIVDFAGVTSRAAAEALHGQVLSAEPLDDPDALWVHDLVGSTVSVPDGSSVGTVVAVQANPASDLLVLDTGALVPLRFVTATEPGRVSIDPPIGLFDL